MKKKQLTELAIINGTYREPNLFSKKLQFQNNHIPIGAPLIFTSPMQQNLLASQMQAATTSTLFSAAQMQQTLASLPQNSEANFLQLFAPFQTIDQTGGMLTNGTHLRIIQKGHTRKNNIFLSAQFVGISLVFWVIYSIIPKN